MAKHQTPYRTFLSKIAAGNNKSAVRWGVIIIIVLCIGVWWAFRPRSTAVQPAGANDVGAPARCLATLTLAGGQRLTFDSASSGVLATQGGARIVKGSDGRVTYQMVDGSSGEILYNTISNPRGSTVMDVTLSDGTRVWLNAGSSIRWTAVFPSEDRTVEVLGEAYFEAASDARRPFRVRMGNMVVEVPGASFNIRAYNDEPLRYVTVVEGKGQVTCGNSVTLEAGELAVVGNRVEKMKDARLDAILGWKNGLFSFSHTGLVSVMRELGRWYNVDVVYQNYTADRYFTGKLDRTLTLDEVLKTLTEGRVHYGIDPGRRRLVIRQ